MRAKGTAYWHEALRKCWLLYLFLSSFLIAIISYYYVKKNTAVLVPFIIEYMPGIQLNCNKLVSFLSGG